MDQFIANTNIVLVIVLLVLGFVFLIKGADFFVEGSSSVAKRFHVPSIIIGLTVVAMGTSLPETAVSVTASLVNNNTLAISNAVGSNIFNTMVVIGVCSILTPVAVSRQTIVQDIPVSAICAIFLAALGMLGIADATNMTLGHLDGAIMLIIFVIYLFVLVRMAMKSAKSGGAEVKEAELKEAELKEDEVKVISVPLSLLFIIGGAAAIAFGGKLTVSTASRIASDLGMSQTLIGLTIVSIGTSLPELVTSVVAARKNEVDMALGNAIGSNIFNILMVLGIASVLSPINFITENIIDIAVLLVFTLLVWLFGATKKSIARVEGLIMVLLYAAYAVYICIR